MSLHESAAAALRREALYLLRAKGLLELLQETLGSAPILVGSVDLDLMTWPDIDVWLPLEPANKGRFVNLAPELYRHLADADIIVVRMSFNDEYLRPGNPYGAGLYWGFNLLPGSAANHAWKLDVWAYDPSTFQAKVAQYQRLKADLAAADRDLILRIKDAVCRRSEYRKTLFSSDVYAFALARAGTTEAEFDAFVAAQQEASQKAGKTAASPGKPLAAGGAIVNLEQLEKEHPRLLATVTDFARIKALVAKDAIAKQWFEALRSAATQILGETVSRYEIPDGLRLLSTSRRVVDRVYKLAMAYRFDGDRRFVERTWQELSAAAAFPDWNPRHFLDSAEMAHAFAIGYDWLYDAWTEEQRTVLRKALLEKGLEPALKVYRGTAPREWSWWLRATHNWNLVCNGGVAMGALAIADEEPELAAELLQCGLKSVPLAIGRFAPDGGWDEGVGYWHYSIRYLVPYLAALHSALGTDFGLSQTPGLAEAGTFPIYLTGPTGQTFNFADSGAGTVRSAELFWLARQYDQPAYAWWQQHMAGAAGGPAGLLWRDPTLTERYDPALFPLDRYFRGVEVTAFRSAWQDPDATFVAFKAGDNRANHGDLDLGTFVMDALGVRWAEEFGGDDYNLPGYFGSQRWTYYRKRAEGQNTLLIDPGAGPDQDPTAVAQIVFQESRPEEAVAIADLTPGYLRSATQVHRGVALLDHRRQVLIQDEVAAQEPADVWWFMHTKAEVQVSEDGASATLARDGKRLLARILSPSAARFTVMSARPLPSSPDPAGQNVNAGVRKLAIHLSGVTDLRLAVQLAPLPEATEGGFSTPSGPRVVPLAEWRSGQALR